MSQLAAALDAPIDALLPEMEAIYQDLHRNPELSMEEFRTAGIAADYLAAHGFEVTRGVGGTGVVGVFLNGNGPTVMLRADMDALPVAEATGLPYASTVKARDEDGNEVGVSHVCGHDLHVTWLMGAARLLSEHRATWKGTVLAVFQPGEEVGRGAHGSMPQTSIDPVIMAASTVLRLQTIVSREIGPLDSAVVTVGALQAGTKENIIPDDATLKLNIRTYDEDVREHVLSAVTRICCAECSASNAPRDPEFTTLNSYPLTENDAAATARVIAAFRALFGERAYETAPASASDDFSMFGRQWGVPYVFWIVGGTDMQTYLEAKAKKQINAIPANHLPMYAPTLHPTLKTGLQAMLTAASARLCADADAA